MTDPWATADAPRRPDDARGGRAVTRSSRWYLLGAVGLLLVAVVAVLVAANSDPTTIGPSAGASGDGSTAPALRAEGWINSEPLTRADLEGKVVLYDFWTYSCVNCVRTIPYVDAWHRRYADDGLVVIGVHSPEFEFEKDHGNVREAVERLGVSYPVALDDEMVIWNEFRNRYWPAHYVYDRDGKQVDVHIGEGGYDETEDLLRELLGVDESSPRARPGKGAGSSSALGAMTRETYLGSLRGGRDFASPQPLADGTAEFTGPEELATNQVALVGRWNVTPEYVEAVDAGASIEIRYVAGEVNLVMEASEGPVDVTVAVDDRKPRVVRVDAADMYRLVHDEEVGDHVLRLTAREPGLRAFAFTFGGGSR